MRYMKEKLEEARKEIGPLLDVLIEPGSLWHRISLTGLKSIVEGGFILPTGHGPEPTYPQTKVSVAMRMGAISVFDFASAKIEDVLDQQINWGGFMVDRRPTFVLRIDKEKLDEDSFLSPQKLTENDLWPMHTLRTGDEIKAYHIHAVEAWHLGKLSTDLVSECLLFPDSYLTKYTRKNFKDLVAELQWSNWKI